MIPGAVSVPLAKDHTGLRIDAAGVLGRIAHVSGELQKLYNDDDQADPAAVAEVVRRNLPVLEPVVVGELLRLLRLTADAFYGGDLTAPDAFFQLWCLDAERKLVDDAREAS